jgi:hypothetical protein
MYSANAVGPMEIATGFPHLNSGASAFPDPYWDLASQAMPRSMPEALRWAERVHQTDGIFSEAMNRVAAYFVTDIEITGPPSGSKEISEDEKGKWREYIDKTLKLRDWIHKVAVNYLWYGVAHVSVITPFRRYLVCPECQHRAPFTNVYDKPVYSFAWTDFKFTAKCPVCGFQGAWQDSCKPQGAESDVVLKIWSPHQIEILAEDFTGFKDFIWNPTFVQRDQVRKGHRLVLERYPKEALEAVKHNAKVRLKRDLVFQICDPALAGIDMAGWGMARALKNFRQAWYCQVLRRFNETICVEHIVPFRVITPLPRPGADPDTADPLKTHGMHKWQAALGQIVAQHRRAPGGTHTLPFPIQSTLIGGEANTLAPFQLLDQARDDLLNASGVPLEFYKMTLSTQSAPAALRLFESHWGHLVYALNQIAQYVVDRSARILNWSPVQVALKKVTIADDMDTKLAKLQLYGAGQISGQRALEALGIPYKEDQYTMLEEQKDKADKVREMQEEMGREEMMRQFGAPQTQGQGQAPPPGGGAGAGAPPAAGGGAPADGSGMNPDDLMTQAQDLAQQFKAMPEGERRSQLLQMKRENRSLHALVKSYMDDIDQQASRQGRDQILGQGGQPGQAA